MSPAPPLVAVRSHEQRVLRRFDELRRGEQLCDVTLVVEDVRFKAHAALLAASSDFFSVMFTAGGPPPPSTLRLDGMTPPQGEGRNSDSARVFRRGERLLKGGEETPP
uniref:BTB domain-containing protein n=1 Tax=Oryzias melastigma TaxID=30732 RepID=A0A3B3E366_ORYME